MIEYSYNEESLLEFKLKLIDFGLSSIVIYDDNKYKILKYFNLKEYKNPNIINPIKSNLWNKLDILYFITFFLFNYYVIEENFKNNLNYTIILNKYKESNNIKELIIKICKIFDINENYIDNFKKDDYTYIKKMFYILQNREYRKKIYGYNFNIDNCNPINFKKCINEILLNNN
jgi:hypothetical protein